MAMGGLRAISSLDGDHQAILERAVQNILATSLAQITLAQIIDGVPTSDVERDNYRRRSISYLHPLHEKHKTVCSRALERLHELSGQFHLGDMQFSAELTQEASLEQLMFEFNSLSPGSLAFNTRLIELVARTIHDIAANLHETETKKVHDGDDLMTWVPSEGEDPAFWTRHPKGEIPPTLLRHGQYITYRLYPRQIADGVGYWAEARILGGVVLFDRKDAQIDGDADPHKIYFHSDRKGVTYRIYALLDEQKRKLLDFLLQKGDQSMGMDDVSPLPILGTLENRTRIDPEEAPLQSRIYRDPWEREPPSPENDLRWVRRRALTGNDWTSWDEFQASVRRAELNRREWYARDEDEDEDYGDVV